jgi:archaellum component FlaC
MEVRMGEHDRLVADYSLLESSKKNLRDIKRSLNGIEKHRDDIHDIWGHEKIADKMDEFVDNWDNYRRELLENVEDLGKRVEAALQSFQKLDLDLKNANEKKRGASGGN